MDTGVQDLDELGSGDRTVDKPQTFEEPTLQDPAPAAFGEPTLDEGASEIFGTRAERLTSISAMDVVLELCDEASQGSTTKIALPNFSEKTETRDPNGFAPQEATQIRRERLLREAGDWTALGQLLIERAEQTERPSDAANLLVDAAEIFGEKLASAEGAQAIYQKALEIDPAHEEASVALERLAERTGDWDELITSLVRAAVCLLDNEPARAGALHIRAACAKAHGLRDVEGAAASLGQVEHVNLKSVAQYLDALESMACDAALSNALVVLCERIGDGERGARLLSRAAARSQSVLERADLHYRIAKLEREGGEAAAARWHLGEVARLDPSRNDARDALAELQLERGDFRGAASTFESARACATSSEDRARYARGAAEIYSEHLGQETKAVDLFAVALKAGCGHGAASMPVIERYYQQQRWSELEAVITPVLDSEYARDLTTVEQVGLRAKAAACANELGRHEQALVHYEAILALEPDHLGALQGAAEAALESKRFSDANAAAQRAIAQVGIGHDDGPVVDMLAVCGFANRSLGNEDRAMELFARCAVHGHRVSMQALAELHAVRGQHHEAVAMQLRVASVSPIEERIEILCQASDALAEEIGDLEAAIDLCFQALAHKPKSRAALHRLAVLHSRNEEWRDSIKVIVRMAGLESGPVRRGRYLQAAGAIAVRHGTEEEAVALLNRAIDSFFTDSIMAGEAGVRLSSFSCFEDILAVLQENGSWREVERNYRRMICRLEPGDPDVGRLWSELGHVYKEKLGEMKAAIDSFEVASTFETASLTNHRILVDLYEGAGADQLDKAIERRRLLLEAEPNEPQHYKALRGLFVRTRQMDRVWCVCRALVSMDAAEQREVAFYRRSLTSEMLWPRSPMDASMWSRLRDRRVDPRISRIYGIVSELVALQHTQAAPRVQEELAPYFDHLRQLFSATSYAFGIPQYSCVIAREQREGASLINLHGESGLTPTFLLGDVLYRGRTIPQIVSGMGRVLALGRRSYFLRLALREPAELAAAFYAGLRLGCPEVRVPAQLSVRTEQLRDALARGLHATWRKKLTDVAQAFVADGSRFSLDDWCRGVDATARHAALLLSGDLEFGLSEIRREHGAIGEVSAFESTALRVASVSKEHMDLREALGLQIPASLPA